MFGKDIDKQMANTIEKQVAELTTQRVRIIDEKLAALHTESDSISRINTLLQEDANKIHSSFKHPEQMQLQEWLCRMVLLRR